MDQAQNMLDAVKSGDVNKVKELLAADPALVNAKDESANSATLLAIYYGRREVRDVLLAHRPDLNLFEAAAAGRLDRVTAIVEEDRDVSADLVNTFSHDGFTPLGLAAFFGHTDVAMYLLSKGAQVNVASQNRMRVMPLHSAVAGKHIEIARALIDNGADVNARQADGFAPLHGAAQNGQVETIELLIAHGAEINAPSDDGKTALSYTLGEGHTEAADLLRRHGAT
jgi:ankyrin repeat protein